jgi:hypothetical protein
VSKQENQKYLASQWARALWVVAPALLLIGALTVLNRNAGIVRLAPALGALAVLVLALGYAWWTVQRVSSERARALRSPSPDALLALTEKSFGQSRIPDGDAFLAQSRAVALALYGEGQRARDALASIDWQRRAPLIQAAGAASDSLIASICERDFAQALRAARRAKSLAELAPGTTGAAASNRFYATVLAFAQVLANEEDAATLATLEAAAKVKRLATLQAIALGGLVAHAQRAGTPERLEALRSELLSVAPALHALLFRESAGS